MEIFSDLVARLGSDHESLGLEDYDESREHLRALLVVEMRKRMLWRSPPVYLGVHAKTWSDEGALDELVFDAYNYIFVHRLPGLIRQRQVRSNIRPMVRRNVKNFLTDRQRKNDPLGYRLFGRLRAAVTRCLERGRLFLRGGNDEDEQAEDDKPPPVGNDTLLSFRRGLIEIARALLFDVPVRRWNDDLLPELVNAEGRSVPKVVGRLADHVNTLPDDDIEAFRFGDLINALKQDVRKRWHGLWRVDVDPRLDGEGPEAPAVLVTEAVEEVEPHWLRRRDLALARVDETIQEVSDPADREQLWKIWIYLKSTRLEAGGDDADVRFPSASKIERATGVPRKRVPKLLERLHQLVEDCLRRAGRTDTEPAPRPRAVASPNPPETVRALTGGES